MTECDELTSRRVQSDSRTEDECRIGELLDYIDTKSAGRTGPQDNRRESLRKQLREWCSIRFLARDGLTVLTAVGKTRDMSRTGLGFLTNRHIAHNSAVLVTVELQDGRRFTLNGVVAHSRAVRNDWYLTGVRFAAPEDSRLEFDEDEDDGAPSA